jgi:hypothetical protein
MNNQTDALFKEITVSNIRKIAQKYRIKNMNKLQKIPLIEILKTIPEAKKELIEATRLLQPIPGTNYYIC